MNAISERLALAVIRQLDSVTSVPEAMAKQVSNWTIESDADGATRVVLEFRRDPSR